MCVILSLTWLQLKYSWTCALVLIDRTVIITDAMDCDGAQLDIQKDDTSRTKKQKHDFYLDSAHKEQCHILPTSQMSLLDGLMLVE
jgi:hypothetical protein